MAQLSPVPAYDDNMDQDPEPEGSWAGLLNQTVAQFAAEVAEASRRLSAAAAAFASQAARTLEEAAGRAYEAVAASRQMADEAGRAAADAHSVRSSLVDLVSGARDQVDHAVTEAVERIAAEARRCSDDVKMALESSIAAGQQAADAARDAAAEARRAAGETGAPGRPGSGVAADVLDRLEADYKLLSDLVSHLHDRVSGLSGVGPASEARGWDAAAPLDPAPEGVPQETAWQPHTLPPAADDPAYPAGQPGGSWIETPTITVATDESAEGYWETSEPPGEEAVAPDGGPPEPLATQYAHGETTPPASDEGSPHPHSAAVWEPQDEAHPGAAEPWDDRAAESRHGPPWAPEASSLETTDLPTGGAGPAAVHAAEPAEPGILLDGRIVLNVEPVPDFDRLLSLDAALSRLSSVRNVTLGDYAKNEVTFRLEMREATNVDSFTSELTQATGQALEVKAASTGNLQLRFRAG